MRLTDIGIKALELPSKGVTIYFDDLLTGFGVRVSKGGTKSFVLTFGPRRQRETIGRVGVLSLAEARAEAKRRLAEYTLGRERPQSISWAEAVEEYLEEKSHILKASTMKDYKDRLGRHFKFGATKLSELSPRDLHRTLDRLRGAPAEHLHAFVQLRGFMSWAFRKYYVDRNPMERMQPPKRLMARARILTIDELRRVWLACEDDTYGKIVKLLMLTGQRRGEISNLAPSMIGEGKITFPSSLTKNHREHTFPIGSMAQELLASSSHGEGLLFAALGTAGKKPFNGFSKCKRQLDEASGTSGWRLHDLRRTFASGLASLGVALPVIERLLNHVSGSFAGIVGVYQRYDYMPEMCDAVERWDRHLQAIAKHDQRRPALEEPRLLTWTPSI